MYDPGSIEGASFNPFGRRVVRLNKVMLLCMLSDGGLKQEVNDSAWL